MEPQYLSVDDVLAFHEALVADAVQSGDPIYPPGVKSQALLESAVGRQQVGYGGKLKYSSALDNAATLVYGLCSNHAFHNGNKRTALLAMIAHLDRNNFVLAKATQQDLLNLMIAIADHRVLGGNIRVRLSRQQKMSADAEVQAIAAWLRKNAVKATGHHRSITYRELKRIIGRFGFRLIPDSARGNQASIYKDVERTRLLRAPVFESKRIGCIGYRDEGTFVSPKDLASLRRACELDPEHGVDDVSFFDLQSRIDASIVQYRRTIRRLARR